MQDLQIYFAIAARAAAEPTWPAWKPGSEFTAKRDAMLGKK